MRLDLALMSPSLWPCLAFGLRRSRKCMITGYRLIAYDVACLIWLYCFWRQKESPNDCTEPLQPDATGRSEKMGRIPQGLYCSRQALVLDRDNTARFTGKRKILQALGQRLIQAVELQAGQIVGFIFEQGIGRQEARGDKSLNITAGGG